MAELKGALMFKCPKCYAEPGDHCYAQIGPDSFKPVPPHVERYRAAQTARGEEPGAPLAISVEDLQRMRREDPHMQALDAELARIDRGPWGTVPLSEVADMEPPPYDPLPIAEEWVRNSMFGGPARTALERVLADYKRLINPPEPVYTTPESEWLDDHTVKGDPIRFHKPSYELGREEALDD